MTTEKVYDQREDLHTAQQQAKLPNCFPDVSAYDIQSTDRAEPAAVNNFCLDCKFHKASKTTAPMLNEVRCFHPQITSLDVGYRVLGHSFQGASCLVERNASGACGIYGKHFARVAPVTKA